MKTILRLRWDGLHKGMLPCRSCTTSRLFKEHKLTQSYRSRYIHPTTFVLRQPQHCPAPTLLGRIVLGNDEAELNLLHYTLMALLLPRSNDVMWNSQHSDVLLISRSIQTIFFAYSNYEEKLANVDKPCHFHFAKWRRLVQTTNYITQRRRPTVRRNWHTCTQSAVTGKWNIWTFTEYTQKGNYWERYLRSHPPSKVKERKKEKFWPFSSC